jgi:AraC family transcriptional regulator
MDTQLTNRPTLLHQPPSGAKSLLVDVVESSAPKGEWATPAVKETSLALALSNFSATWRGSRGLQSQHVSSGTMAICELDRSRHFEMKNDAKFGIVMVSNEALEQAAQGTRRPELQPHDLLQDLTLRRLTKILLAEKRSAFRSGLFFLDGVTSALVSYLLRHYSVAPPLPENSSGGLPPAALRRCVELMEERLEGNLRLSDLADEVGFSTSHLIRSFRQSTGKTPYQFLLHQRIERARALMRDLRTPLTQVALASGFADQHHLARVFRRITGLTPTDYRRSL